MTIIANITTPRLNLDIEDLSNRNDAEQLKYGGCRQNDVAPSLMQQGHRVVRINRSQKRDDPNGQGTKNPRGTARRGRQSAKVGHQLVARANCLRNLFENLTEIATGLSLNVHCRNAQTQVHYRDAIGKTIQGSLCRETELLSFKRDAKFRRDWIRHISRDLVQRFRK